VGRAVIIGGTGAIGRATARRLLAAGWSVDLTGRDPARMPRDIAASGGRFIAADRAGAARLRVVCGTGAGLLVDCACYTAEDARNLLPLACDAASAVMISSKAVYADASGHHSNSPVKPGFGGPVREDQPTVAPSALEISRIIARHLGLAWDEVLLDGQEAPARLGRTPRDKPHPFVLDMTAAAGLGYVPAGDYAATVAAEMDWLAAAARGGEDADLIPGPGDSYFAPLLDYPAEDRWLAGRRMAGTGRGSKPP
jgi:NAD(P)-dependent dehydrogenase (short-subunit alcohol dehydrogenase family)